MDQLIPNEALRSILKASPADSYARVLGASLLVLGQNIPQLATRLERKYQHVNRVIHGKRYSQTLRQRIADLLGVCVSDIWPMDSHDQRVDQ